MTMSKICTVTGLVAVLGLSAACERKPPAPETDRTTGQVPGDETTGSERGAPAAPTNAEPDRPLAEPVGGRDEDSATGTGAGGATEPAAGRDEALPPAEGSAKDRVAGDEGSAADARLLLVDEEGDVVPEPVTDGELIGEVERKLEEAGMNPGTIDGKADATLLSAVRQFQAKKGLDASGRLDRRTVEALGLPWERVQQATPNLPERVEDRAQDLKEGAKDLGRDVQRGVKDFTDDVQERRPQ